jgi:diguanylate cyclase (GGDEF)-like protein
MEQIKILVVEDSKMFANIITGKIQDRLGFRCQVAPSLESARVLVDKGASDYFMAVLDLNLPDARDGEIVDYILAKGIPAVVFTANVDDDTREQILSRNIVDYVLKESNLDIDYLVRIIDRLYKNQRVKVLVVEDSNVTRSLLRNLLQTHKFTVMEAHDGNEGLEILEQNPEIKLIITDFSMPKMDGFQFVSAVRKKHPPDQLAIIGISAHDSALMSAKFLKKGANDFIHKPFVKEEFYCRVNHNIEMLEYIETIRETSHKDYLTGLYNRRYFFELGRKMFENAKRGNLEITIAMFDIDYFKNINDTYGHEAGDIALKYLAQLITTNRRAADVVARFGGEEFCMLGINMKREKILPFFEDLRQRIEKKTLQWKNTDISLTVSIGVVTRLEHSLEATINRADELMYQAKEQGRNRVVIDY